MTRTDARQMSGPVPSPSMKGMMGWSGTASLPRVMVMRCPAGGGCNVGMGDSCLSVRELDLFPEAFAVGGHLLGVILFELEDEADVVAVVARRHVKVHVEDRLAGGLAVVGKYVEALRLERGDDRPRDDVRGGDEIGELRLRDVEKGRRVRPGNDEDMSVVNRIDVENGDGVAVGVEQFGSRFAPDDATEGAGGHRVMGAEDWTGYQKSR